jgi:hypothetical protein
MSRVGVWINNHNNAQHLAGAISSVLKQNYRDFTLYAVDNSTDPAATQIWADAFAADNRIVLVELPESLKRRGIPTMDYAWRFLNDKGHDYTITLGGHDFWAEDTHLEVLVNRMDAELKAFGPEGASLLYCDTWQVNEATEIIGRFQNIMQFRQVPRAFIPQAVITTIDSPQFFGLWNETIRRKLPIRHLCSGFDHLIVMEAALRGAILYEGGAKFIMRAPKPDDDTSKYGLRHLSDEVLAAGPQSYIDQLEWLAHAVDLATDTLPPEAKASYKMMLTASIVDAYCVLRGYNLLHVPGAYQAFTANPLTIDMMKGAHHTYRMLNSLIQGSKPRT